MISSVKTLLILATICTALLFVFNEAKAAEKNIPLPERKTLSLDTIKSALKEQEKKKVELESQIKVDEKDIASLQKKLVSLTAENRKIETDLKNLKSRRDVLLEQKEQSQMRLNLEKDQTSSLVTALVRIKLLPKPIYFLSQDTPEELGLTQASLSLMIPQMIKNASYLSDEIEGLSKLEKKLEIEETRIALTQNKLDDKKNTTHALIEKRRELFDEHKDMHQQYAKQIEQYAKQAKTMEEFINRLQTTKPKLSNKKEKKNYALALPSKGKQQLPITGIIKVGFGQMDTIGAKSEGLHLQTSGSTTAIAPMGGVVRYIGSFNTYHNMIIIEHKGDYHSLISGLDQINVELGQSVISGEPLGVIGNGQSTNSVLYYELRFKGRPINPIKT